MKRLLLTAGASLCALAGMTTTAHAQACAATAALPHTTNLAQVRSATLCLLNRERAAHGLRALRPVASLRSMATAFSTRMVIDNFFDHTTPSGTTFADRVHRTAYFQGGGAIAAGENIYYGTGTNASPAVAVDTWMHSPGHRANILDGRYRAIGIGIARGIPGQRDVGATYTTDFGAHV